VRRAPRPAAVEHVGGVYVVVGVAVGDLPMVVPTVEMRIVPHLTTRTRQRRWRLEIGGEVYVHAGTLRQARLDASTQAFARDEVPSTRRPRVTARSPVVLWLTALRAYVAGVFRGRFPAAGTVTVDLDEELGTWRVVVDDALWTMQISSDDDDEFRFTLTDGRHSALVQFPIPEEL